MYKVLAKVIPGVSLISSPTLLQSFHTSPTGLPASWMCQVPFYIKGFAWAFFFCLLFFFVCFFAWHSLSLDTHQIIYLLQIFAPVSPSQWYLLSYLIEYCNLSFTLDPCISYTPDSNLLFFLPWYLPLSTMLYTI